MAGVLEAVITMPWYNCKVRTWKGETCKCTFLHCFHFPPYCLPYFSYVEKRKNPNNSTNQQKSTKPEDAIKKMPFINSKYLSVTENLPRVIMYR